MCRPRGPRRGNNGERVQRDQVLAESRLSESNRRPTHYEIRCWVAQGCPEVRRRACPMQASVSACGVVQPGCCQCCCQLALDGCPQDWPTECRTETRRRRYVGESESEKWIRRHWGGRIRRPGPRTLEPCNYRGKSHPWCIVESNERSGGSSCQHKRTTWPWNQ